MSIAKAIDVPNKPEKKRHVYYADEKVRYMLEPLEVTPSEPWLHTCQLFLVGLIHPHWYTRTMWPNCWALANIEQNTMGVPNLLFMKHHLSPRYVTLFLVYGV